MVIGRDDSFNGLQEAAIASTGLTDFGEPDYHEGLQKLLDSVMSPANADASVRAVAENLKR